MKRIACFCFVVAMVMVSSAFGQQAGPIGGAPPVASPPKAHKNALVVEREVLEKLDLTASQKDQVKTAITTLGTSLKDLRKSAKGDEKSEEVKEKRKAIRKTYIDSLKGILTPDQFKKYHQLHREMAKKPVEPVVVPPKPAQ